MANLFGPPEFGGKHMWAFFTIFLDVKCSISMYLVDVGVTVLE